MLRLRGAGLFVFWHVPPLFLAEDRSELRIRRGELRVGRAAYDRGGTQVVPARREANLEHSVVATATPRLPAAPDSGWRTFGHVTKAVMLGTLC